MHAVPAQHGSPPKMHDAPWVRQVAQKQLLLPPVQGTTTFGSTASVATQESPVQQSGPPAPGAAQEAEMAAHVAGAVQTPPVHCSPSAALQQSAAAAQVPPVAAQVEVELHVPLVAPGGTSQVSPEQQSPSTVQEPADPTQGATHTPALASQAPEQHWLSREQPLPFAAHWPQVPVAGSLTDATQAPEQHAPGSDVEHEAPSATQVQASWQEPPASVAVQVVPVQQGSGLVPGAQPAPRARQASLPAAQRRMPAASGTHGAPSQH